jgi:hypothetical protein
MEARFRKVRREDADEEESEDITQNGSAKANVKGDGAAARGASIDTPESYERTAQK